MTREPILVPVQQLPTHCARCVQPFHMADQLYLAVAQFARDIPGESPGMHAGDSNVATRLYQWAAAGFTPVDDIPSFGAEDAEYFVIDGRQFLAIANIRSGIGPYQHDVESVIYTRDDDRWLAFQHVESFGAKQWRHFEIEGQHYLALAQGILVPGLETHHPATSRIYRWNGEDFEVFQVLEGRWGYNWTHVEHRGRHFLAYADHLLHSPVLEWRDGRFEPWLEMAEEGGRAFAFFDVEGELLGVFASISGRTVLGTFSDQGFDLRQDLGGPGGRELALLEHEGQRYLARVAFITGGREAPQTVQESELFHWRKDRFHKVAGFTTHGGTSAAWFLADGHPHLVVANSLSPQVRFSNDCQVYRLDV
ncbi:hypothetical protein [Pseudomonas alkylphenolica]|uniref:hypothetical protein n=1 Tax=Pseudomonas alkylphenolica TaxID=237609 RepID=UPI0018D6902C|nr:hypothetical protein [Pseudomonas alkylphenolica]MBH3429074.1 hypothetical protein [Pseudomonas alkylphenolica]